jgi:hypothetical protein
MPWILIQAPGRVVEFATQPIYNESTRCWETVGYRVLDPAKKMTVQEGTADSAPAPPVLPYEDLIDVPAFLARFGNAAMWRILASTDPNVVAVVRYLNLLPWVDLKRQATETAVDMLIAANIQGVTAGEKAAVLNDPVTPNENRVLRRLHF